MTHDDDLRAWAKGSLAVEAGTELLLRAFGGRFAAPGNPWVYERVTRSETYSESAWIDFEGLGEHAIYGAYSAGERRFLLLAASLASDTDVVLGDAIQGLGRATLDLVLAAVAYAGGRHLHPEARGNEDRSPALCPGSWGGTQHRSGGLRAV